MKNQYISLLIFVLSLTGASVNAQKADSVFIRNDTAYIIKSPVVITKKVYVKEATKKENKIPSSWFFSPYAKMSYTLDYISVCSEKRDYYGVVDSATTPGTNASFGGRISYQRKRMLYSLDLAYTSFRESFDFQETSVINSHKVITISAEAGYYILNRKSFHVLLSAGAGYLYTLNINGNTIDENNYNLIISQSEQGTLDKYSIIATGKILGYYNLKDHLSLFFGPSYMGNIISITRKDIPYDKWKNDIGLMAGVRFKLLR